MAGRGRVYIGVGKEGISAGCAARKEHTGAAKEGIFLDLTSK